MTVQNNGLNTWRRWQYKL